MKTNNTQLESEQALLFAKGNQQALAWFYHSLYPALSLFAYHFVKDRAAAEEIASDGFIKTWQQNSKLDTAGSIRAYLYTVVRNDCIRFIKKENKKSKSLREIPIPISIDETGFDKMVMAELSRHLNDALHKLSPGACSVLRLHFLEGKSLREIAEELQLSQSTVKTQKQRGLKALQKKLIRPFLAFFSTL